MFCEPDSWLEAVSTEPLGPSYKIGRLNTHKLTTVFDQQGGSP